MLFRCILSTVRGEVESCLSPSALSPVKPPAVDTALLLPISLQPILVIDGKSVREQEMAERQKK